MIDPIISLAFSVHKNKGVYALLLGSGVSRSAEIPTGWEVVLDLIRQLAHLQNTDCEPDPAAWYVTQFGEEPDYSKLLEELAKSPSERSQLLRNYFEPNEEEREEGKKLPTPTHKAIAQLVVSGHIRVIITTNFDRLLEKALEEVGIHPTVISTLDSLKGAMPLIHTNCTIIKVHGDYLDTRIKNTPTELEKYESPLNQLLDRIFDEFGLIVCGWSAEWDKALRSAIERCPNRRFTTYWAARGQLGNAAQQLVQIRGGEVVTINDSDAFFQELSEKISALEEFDRPHPLSAKIVVATLKKYLVEDRYKIRLHDLVQQETEKLYSSLSVRKFSFSSPISQDELMQRVRYYESLAEIPLALMITGCYWGEEEHESSWLKCLARIANPPEHEPAGIYHKHWKSLSSYPALLLFYAGGIAAIAAGKYRNLEILMTKISVRDVNDMKPLALCLHSQAVMEIGFARNLYEKERDHTPLSEHLYEILRLPFQELLPQDTHYQKCFDRFEYLLALTFTDLCAKLNKNYDWLPLGSFGWRSLTRDGDIIEEIEIESKEGNSAWPPIKAGMFGGSIERFQKAKIAYDNFLSDIKWR